MKKNAILPIGRWLGLLSSLPLLVIASAALAADDADLFSSKMSPNVLLIVDNSTSMFSSIFSAWLSATGSRRKKKISPPKWPRPAAPDLF